MRAIWSGAISFALVNIPIKLYSAVENKSLNFHFLHNKDLSPIRFAKVCRVEEEEVPSEDIVRGYEYVKGNYVVMEDSDFNRANVRKTSTIDILEFVDEKEIDALYFEKPYYLGPDRAADKAFSLLREALKKTGKVAMARFVLRNREHICALKPLDNALLLNRMRFATEIRNVRDVEAPEAKDITEQEMNIAVSLIEQLTKKFEPEKFRDTYTEDLKAVIEEKVEGRVPAIKGEKPKLTEVTDLMEVLKKSLETAKKAA